MGRTLKPLRPADLQNHLLVTAFLTSVFHPALARFRCNAIYRAALAAFHFHYRENLRTSTCFRIIQGVGCCTQAMSSGATRDAVEFTEEDDERGVLSRVNHPRNF